MSDEIILFNLNYWIWLQQTIRIVVELDKSSNF